MSVAGFKAGDRVMTPGGYTGTVRERVSRTGREYLIVAYDHPVLTGVMTRRFAAATLRRQGR